MDISAPAARRSILGHRMSGSAIRSGRLAGFPSSHINSQISTTRGRDDCGKPLSQHLSFGATIRAIQGWNPSAEPSPVWTAASKPPPPLTRRSI